MNQHVSIRDADIEVPDNERIVVLDNIIGGQPREAAERRLTGRFSFPVTTAQDVASALKLAKFRKPVSIDVVIAALSKIGREANWIDDEDLEVQAELSGSPIKHMRGSIAAVNAWLADIGSYVERHGTLKTIEESGERRQVLIDHDGRLCQGGVTTAFVLAGDEIAIAPWNIAQALLAGAQAIIKPSRIEPLSAFLFTKALIAAGLEPPALLYISRETEAEQALLATLIKQTRQSVMYGEDATVDAICSPYRGNRSSWCFRRSSAAGSAWRSRSASRKGFQNAANYIDDVPAGSVIVVSNDGNTSCTNWGDILTNKAVSRGIAGTVINGSARDIETVRAHGYPLYSRGVFMVSGKNRVELKATNVRVFFDEVPVDPGDWIFADDNGVVVIPPDRLEEVVTRAEAITETESRIVASISAGESLAAARDRFGYAAPWDGPAKADVQPSVANEPADFVSHWREQLDFVDIHYHADPDTYARKLNAIEAGNAYKALRGGVVLKSHLGCTGAVASLCRSLGQPVFGSTSLNAIAGGLGIVGIKRSLCLRSDEPGSARLVVDLPTVVSTTHESKLKRPFANSASATFSQVACAIADDEGRLLPEVDALLDFCKDQPVVLTTGHATRRQTEALIELCAKKGGVRLLLNQPANPITGLDAAALRALSMHEWLFVEQTALTYLLGYQSLGDFLEVLRSVDNLVYSSDLGQQDKMAPDAWREASRGWFAEAGLGEERAREITLLNPLRMLAP